MENDTNILSFSVCVCFVYEQISAVKIIIFISKMDFDGIFKEHFGNKANELLTRIGIEKVKKNSVIVLNIRINIYYFLQICIIFIER